MGGLCLPNAVKTMVSEKPPMQNHVLKSALPVLLSLEMFRSFSKNSLKIIVSLIPPIIDSIIASVMVPWYHQLRSAKVTQGQLRSAKVSKGQPRSAEVN